MTRGRLRRRSDARVGALALALTAAVVCLAGCAGRPATADPDSWTGASATTTGTVPGSGAGTAAKGGDTLPSGWTRGSAEGLRFGVPPGMEPAPDGTGIPGASVSFVGRRGEGASIPAAIGAFVERGAVGPLDLRTELVTRVRNDQLRAEPVGPARTLDVPGAIGATVVEWRWDYVLTPGDDPVPSRQVEVVVQVDGPIQYALLFGAPDTVLTDGMLRYFLGSLEVAPGGVS